MPPSVSRCLRKAEAPESYCTDKPELRAATGPGRQSIQQRSPRAGHRGPARMEEASSSSVPRRTTTEPFDTGRHGQFHPPNSGSKRSTARRVSHSRGDQDADSVIDDQLSAQIRDYDTCFAEFLKPSGNGQKILQAILLREAFSLFALQGVAIKQDAPTVVLDVSCGPGDYSVAWTSQIARFLPKGIAFYCTDYRDGISRETGETYAMTTAKKMQSGGRKWKTEIGGGSGCYRCRFVFRPRCAYAARENSRYRPLVAQRIPCARRARRRQE